MLRLDKTTYLSFFFNFILSAKVLVYDHQSYYVQNDKYISHFAL